MSKLYTTAVLVFVMAALVLPGCRSHHSSPYSSSPYYEDRYYDD